MKHIIVIEDVTKKIELTYFSGNIPRIEYDEKSYDAYMPGSTIKTDSLETTKPIPNGIYGFVIDNYILFLTKGFVPHVRIFNKNCNAYIKQTKKHRIIMGIITGIVFVVACIIFLLLTL